MKIQYIGEVPDSARTIVKGYISDILKGTENDKFLVCPEYTKSDELTNFLKNFNGEDNLVYDNETWYYIYPKN